MHDCKEAASHFTNRFSLQLASAKFKGPGGAFGAELGAALKTPKPEVEDPKLEEASVGGRLGRPGTGTGAGVDFGMPATVPRRC